MQHALSLTPDLEIMALKTFLIPPAFKVPGEFSGSKRSSQGLTQIMFVPSLSSSLLCINRSESCGTLMLCIVTIPKFLLMAFVSMLSTTLLKDTGFNFCRVSQVNEKIQNFSKCCSPALRGFHSIICDCSGSKTPCACCKHA